MFLVEVFQVLEAMKVFEMPKRTDVLELKVVERLIETEAPKEAEGVVWVRGVRVEEGSRTLE